MSGFAELGAATSYSFLRGASHPGEMVTRAIALGMAGIGIADRNSVAGVVRAYVALRDADAPGFRLAAGARLVFSDGTPDILAYPADRHGWGRLTRLLTVGNLRAEKGNCILMQADLMAHLEGLLLIGFAEPSQKDFLAMLACAAPGRVWLGAAPRHQGRDRRHLAALAALASQCGVPLVATNDPLYASAGDRPLHDVLSCIRLGVRLADAGRRLQPDAERHLKPQADMLRLFRDCPQAVAESLSFLARIDFSLDQLRYEYPHEPVPQGWTAQAWLEHLVLEAARMRHPAGISAKLQKLLDSEFQLIGQLNYATYFLTVHDLVAFARSRGILCQGRGSAANSAVCFMLGITAVDPEQHDLLFSRFISAERNEPPDIDVDFEHERREEVMQYVYARYGRHRAGIAATVIHFRPRSAVREVGKVLGFSEDAIVRLTSTIWGSFSGQMEDKRYGETGFSLENPDIARLKALVDRILHVPRHLSQHVGGFVLTEGRLDEMVPILNGAMPDRTFIEWDKDDIDALGLMKVDVLALGMLTCIRKSFDLLREHAGLALALDSVPPEDPETYAMLCRGDSIGVFQVESRAQMNMLPRLKPRQFYDLVIQVAIVRPGPIEGEMVHPYLRRRSGIERVVLPSPAPPHDPHELQTVLGKTFGVPLFQEQAMKLAIVAADFSPDDANRLRRAMATFRNVGTIHELERKMIEGMVARGYERVFAERCFRQIEGFGSYGFPESHALAFARLVYVSSWIKCHHPAVFACALLNSQPMGFYAPAQIVRDAAEHGVTVNAIDVNSSVWDNVLEPCGALRLGFRQIDGFRQAWAEALVVARDAPFASLEALARRSGLPTAALGLLSDADALRSIGLDRREALWEARRTPATALPLFAAAGACEIGEEADAMLPKMRASEHVAADYQTLRLSLKGHPMQFLRPHFAAEGVLTCGDTSTAKAGSRVRTAGVVLVRQRPGKGNAIFITIEDETGVCNIVLWARNFERQRRAVMAARLMLVEGEVQRSPEGIVHLMASRITDRSADLLRLSQTHRTEPDMARADEVKRSHPPRSAQSGHPRAARILPRSRDFH